MGRERTPKAPAAHPLKLGGSRTISVFARRKWNRSGILLNSGESYHLQVVHVDAWRDWTIETGPSGFSRPFLRPFERVRRFPLANWFALIGCVDQRRDSMFLIGSTGSHDAGQTGELTCFANDAPWMYWNNAGSLRLSVRRTR